MNSCIVTGCAGFIGSHLCDRLIRNGYKVFGVDSFTAYYPIEIKEENLRNIINNNNFKLIKLDLANQDLRKVLPKTDYIFHLAGEVGVRNSFGENFENYVKNNILATQKILEFAKDTVELKKLIFASSSSVYGEVSKVPISEDMNTSPVSPYGVTKLSSEKLCLLYHKNFRVPVIILRYFTVYGPRQRPDMAIYKFIKAILTGDEIIVYGDGNQTRDFTYVDDIVSANILASNCALNGEIFNIGAGTRINIKALIKMIEKKIGKEAKLKYTCSEKGEMRDTLSDITKAKKVFKYNPKFQIDVGLDREIEWFK